MFSADTSLFRFPEFDFELVLEITNECHGSCAYCYYDFNKPIRVLDPDKLRTFFQLLSQISSKRRAVVYFQGAEALLAPDSFWKRCCEVVRDIHEIGFHLQCHLQSGLYVSPSRLTEVLKLFPFFSTCSTSFDFSRKGFSVSKTKQHLAEFKSRAFDASDSLAFSSAAILTLSKDNFGRISEALDILNRDLEIEKIRFRELVPVDFARDPSVFPSSSETLQMFNEAFDAASILQLFTVVEPFRSMASFLLGYRALGTCMLSSGCSNLFALSGDSIGCCDISLEVSDQRLAFANWNFSSVEEFLSNTLSWRNRLPNACRECKYLGGCWGGCPLRAYLSSGTIHQKDPFCSVIFELYERLEKEQQNRTALWLSLSESVFSSAYLRSPLSTTDLL